MNIINRWLDRIEGRRAARAYQRRMDRAQEAWRAYDAYARTRSCKHENRRPNPEVTAVTGLRAEICNDCGVGYVTAGKP